MARDSTYRPKVYRDGDNNRYVIDSGGELMFVTGSRQTFPVMTATSR